MDSPNSFYEQKFGSKSRFKRMCDLHARYIFVKEKTEEIRKKWQNYMHAYRRVPYLRKDGGRDANFGQFRFKIDNAVGAFKSAIMDREIWAKVSALKAPDRATKAEWSRKISECWHEEFIRPWVEGIIQTNWDVFNMQMFMAGIEHFNSNGDVYPESLDPEMVFPDLGSTVIVKDWEICFVLKRMSMNQLYRHYASKDEAWNKEAIKDLLDFRGGVAQDSLTSMEKIRLNTNENTDTRQSILVVIAYVKEYDENNKGSVTKYVFPEDGILVKKETSDQVEERYLFKRENHCNCISQAISIRTFHPFKEYWSGEGLANGIFVACQQYDMTMNRAIRASLRKATMYFNSQNPDEQDRLRKMPDNEVVVLDPDTKIAQVTVSTELGDLATTTRQLMFDTERGTGESLSAGSQNVRNRAITAEEQRSNVLREAEKQNTQLDIFILQDTFLVREIYRRSLLVSSGEPEYKALERFKNKMAEYGIPEEAYKYENVLVESSFSIFAGSVSGRIQLVDKLIGYTRIKPEHKGVENATREGIAAIVGWDLVDNFFPYNQKPEDSQVEKAGIENEILDDPDLNPINVQVFPTHNHYLHVEMHLSDAENDIELAKGLVEQFKQVPFSSQPVVLEKTHVKIRAIDNKLSHVEAHLSLLSADPYMEAWVKAAQARISRIRNVQQDVMSLQKNNIESYVKDTSENSMLTIEQQHKVAMMKMEEEHIRTLNDIALGKAVEQATLRSKSEQVRQAQDDQRFAQEMAQKQVEGQLDLNHQLRTNATELATKQQQNDKNRNS